MQFAFDHLVHFVENPQEAIKILREKGVHAVEGGEHRNRPTYNALSYFDLSYIEFLSTFNKELLKQTDHPQHSLMNTIINDRFTEGFTRFIIRTNDIDSAARLFSAEGLIVNGPFYLSRKRPDGSVLEWRLLYIGYENDELELPYIIQWNDSDEKRREDLIKRKVIVHHPCGTTFSHLNIAVRNLERTIDKWSKFFSLEVGGKFIDKELQAKCQTLKLPGGNLVFCTPIGPGIVSEVLKNRGEKPFQVNLSCGQKSDTLKLFGGLYKINNMF